MISVALLYWRWHQLLQQHPLNNFFHEKIGAKYTKDTYWFKTPFNITNPKNFKILRFQRKHSFGDILRKCMQIEHLQQILCVFKVPLLKSVCFAVDRIASFGTLNAVVKIMWQILIELRSTSSFLQIEPIYSNHFSFLVFEKCLRSYYCTFWLTL